MEIYKHYNISFNKTIVLAHLVGLLFLSSFIAFLPQFLSLMKGEYAGLTLNGEIGYRYIRELIVILIYLLFLEKILSSFFKASYVVLPIVIIVSVSVVCTTFKYQNLILLITGLRFFEYLILIPIFIYIFKSITKKILFFKIIEKYIVIFLLFEAVIAIFEVLFAPPVLGKTIFGSRAFGTFPSPNLFGITMAILGLYFLIQSKKKLFFLSLVLVILSGSRLAIMTSFFLIIINMIKKIKLKFLYVYFWLIFPFVSFIAFKIFSSSYFSGRHIEKIHRLDVWSEAISNGIKSVIDFIVGWGVGLGSNTTTTLFGPGRFEGQFIADSTFIFLLSSFGVFGLIFYFLSIILTYFKGLKDIKFIFVLLLVSVPVIWFENFPANLLIVMLWSYYISGSIGESSRRINGKFLYRTPNH